MQLTCGFEPVAFTTSPPGAPLADGAVFCVVRSRITGSRLVSLPYADHCALLDNASSGLAQALLTSLRDLLENLRVRSAELRPPAPLPHAARELPRAESTFFWHVLDLAPDLPALRAALHRNSIHRKIRRAEREGLRCEAGRSAQLLRAFYELLLRTRRRHRVPPHPERWFKNLTACFGDALCIWVARFGERPVAAILTLRHGETVVFKYGCSDERFHPLGGVPLLLWRAIEDARSQGLRWFDLGRSAPEAAGLITFKSRWGARRHDLTYARFALRPADLDQRGLGPETAGAPLARRLLSVLPEPLFRAAGSFAFRHLG